MSGDRRDILVAQRIRGIPTASIFWLQPLGARARAALPLLNFEQALQTSRRRAVSGASIPEVLHRLAISTGASAIGSEHS
jgi:hypothetical protein